MGPFDSYFQFIWHDSKSYLAHLHINCQSHSGLFEWLSIFVLVRAKSFQSIKQKFCNLNNSISTIRVDAERDLGKLFFQQFSSVRWAIWFFYCLVDFMKLHSSITRPEICYTMHLASKQMNSKDCHCPLLWNIWSSSCFWDCSCCSWIFKGKSRSGS